ncbi:MAG: hypothetical protein U0324_23875 [Polyangiales bacterium]
MEYAIAAMVVAVALAAAWRLRGGVGVVASAPWTDFRAPAVAGWAATRREDSGPALGLQVGYRAPDVGLVATLYVYLRDEQGVSRDEALLLRELARVEEGLRSAVAAGMWEASKTVSAPAGAAFGGARWLRQRFSVTRRGKELFSEAWVTTHRAFYVKVRATYDLGMTGPAVTRVGALVEAVGAATTA